MAARFAARLKALHAGLRPVLRTPSAILTAPEGRPTLALQTALAPAQQADWRTLLAVHCGALGAAAGRLPFSI